MKKKIKYIRQAIQNINGIPVENQKAKNEHDEIKLLLAKSLISNQKISNSIHDVEFKIFSQWGDDGIIQYLINNIEIQNKIFIEFGVENYTESNTRFLLVNNNWKGLVIDGSEEHINYIKNDTIYWKYDLTAKTNFITAENINQLFLNENISGNIGLLSIDIDGNDYWVWKNITVVDADIVIIEYNSIFGNERAITIPYNANFVRNTAHYSNLYYGVSITSLCDLADEKGYYFVGCNTAGNNAYFIKKHKITNIKPLTIKEGFVDAKFRESRNEKGDLTFLSGTKKQELIKRLNVFNTRTNAIEIF